MATTQVRQGRQTAGPRLHRKHSCTSVEVRTYSTARKVCRPAHQVSQDERGVPPSVCSHDNLRMPSRNGLDGRHVQNDVHQLRASPDGSRPAVRISHNVLPSPRKQKTHARARQRNGYRWLWLEHSPNRSWSLPIASAALWALEADSGLALSLCSTSVVQRSHLRRASL